MIDIVLIDDDVVSSFVTEKFLQKHIKQPFRVFKFSNATDALKEIYSIKPNYLFVDLLMPQMTGLDFIENLDPTALQSKIYVLSGSVDERDIERVDESGKVVGFLPKQHVQKSIQEIFSC
jgi:DNA-binding NarL/FixJ family response regulator